MLDDREANLPKWARQSMKDMRVRLETALEPAVEARKKLEECEKRLRKTQDVLNALQELLFSAAKSGHKTSEEIVSVLESYEIFKPTRSE